MSLRHATPPSNTPLRHATHAAAADAIAMPAILKARLFSPEILRRDYAIRQYFPLIEIIIADYIHTPCLFTPYFVADFLATAAITLRLSQNFSTWAPQLIFSRFNIIVWQATMPLGDYATFRHFRFSDIIFITILFRFFAADIFIDIYRRRRDIGDILLYRRALRIDIRYWIHAAVEDIIFFFRVTPEMPDDFLVMLFAYDVIEWHATCHTIEAAIIILIRVLMPDWYFLWACLLPLMEPVSFRCRCRFHYMARHRAPLLPLSHHHTVALVRRMLHADWLSSRCYHASAIRCHIPSALVAHWRDWRD